jgi:nucleoside-diphosphate-sugar epimerase
VQSRLFVDVRDVAAAHVAAAIELEAAGQRYIVSLETRAPSQDIATWLREVCQTTGLSDPEKVHFDGEFDGGAIPIGSKEVDAIDRLRRELRVTLRPIKDTIRDMAGNLLKETAQNDC